MVCEAIVHPDYLPEGQQCVAKVFRNTMIELLHSKYEGRKQMCKKSIIIESWLAIFLCDLYHYLRLHEVNPTGWQLRFSLY